MKCPVCDHEVNDPICPICQYPLEEDITLHRLLYKLTDEEIEEYHEMIASYRKQYQSPKQEEIINSKQEETVEESRNEILDQRIEECLKVLEDNSLKKQIPSTEALWIQMRADILLKMSEVEHLKDISDLSNIYNTALDTYCMEDYEYTHKLLKIALKEKHFLAYLWLAILYEQGLGVSKNIRVAIKYYKQAIELNNTLAMRRLGNIYLNDSSLMVNKGIKLYERAIELGDNKALLDLIDKYSKGYGYLKPNKIKEMILRRRLKNG